MILTPKKGVQLFLCGSDSTGVLGLEYLFSFLLSAGFIDLQLPVQGLAFERSWGDYRECLAI